MTSQEPDIKADFMAVADRDESIALMEPMILSSECQARSALADLTLELARKSAALDSQLPPGIRTALTELVRTMNCYYSNLIEGHNTHPIDVERAVHGDLEADEKKRNLQLEARAHVQVQAWIDSNVIHLPLSIQTICEIHRLFTEALPDELRYVEDPATGKKIAIAPGEIRSRDVKVGHHVAISPGAISRFLQRYEHVYGQLGTTETILSAAAAHHRLLWIHPFLDGNGRVARLMSYAQLRGALHSGGIWSIARGLARSVNDYKRHLMACDNERWNDYDGRGHLSERALSEFTEYFLRTCIDQVDFMESLIEPNRLHSRILAWCDEESRMDKLLGNAKAILQAVLYRGEIPRGESPEILGVGERQARRVVSRLFERGVLRSESDRAPLKIAFPAALAPRWMPGLFPEKPAN